MVMKIIQYACMHDDSKTTSFLTFHLCLLDYLYLLQEVFSQQCSQVKIHEIGNVQLLSI